MTGRKPKPTQQHIVQGDPSRKGKNKLQRKLAAEPVPARGLPCPKHLTGRARVAWNFWREELEVMKIAYRPDSAMLEGACRHYARAVAADLQVDREGAVIDEPVFYKGAALPNVTRKKKHPAVTVSATSWSLVKSFCSEFGFSPVSRTRLTVEQQGPTPDADLRTLLSGPVLTDQEKQKLQ